MAIKFRFLYLLVFLTILPCYSQDEVITESQGKEEKEKVEIRFDSRFVPRDNKREFTNEQKDMMCEASDALWVIVPRYVKDYPALRKEYDVIKDSFVQDSIDMLRIENIINYNIKKLSSQEAINIVARMIKEKTTSDLNKIPRYNKYNEAEYQRRKSEILQKQTKILKDVEKGKINTSAREQLHSLYYRKRERVLDNRRKLKLLQEVIDSPNPESYKRKLWFDIKEKEYTEYKYMDTVLNPFSYVAAPRNGNYDRLVGWQVHNDAVRAVNGQEISRWGDEYISQGYKFFYNMMYDLDDKPLMALPNSEDIRRPQYERDYIYIWAYYNNLFDIRNSSRKTQDYVKKEMGLQSMGPRDDADGQYWFTKVNPVINPVPIRFFRINETSYAVDYADVNTGKLLYQAQYRYEIPKYSKVYNHAYHPIDFVKKNIAYYKNGETIDKFMRKTSEP